MRNLKGYLLVLGATIFWGISATVAKFLFTHHVDTLTIVQMRMTISCAVLLVILVIARRDLLRVKVGDLYRFALLGICGIAGSNFTYYFAINASNVATAILLQYMAPLLVMIYAAVSREETLTGLKIAAAAVSLTGCFLAVGGIGEGGLSFGNAGLFYGIAAAFCWSFTNIMLKKLLRDYAVWTVIAYAFIAASIFWLIINPPWKIAAAGYSLHDWEVFFVFAMVSVLIPQSFYFSGARHLSATRAIITATFEPVVAIISAYIILGESLTPVRCLGAVLVIAAIILLQYKEDPAVAIVEEHDKIAR